MSHSVLISPSDLDEAGISVPVRGSPEIEVVGVDVGET
jgi:hypothetical protein